MTSAQIEKVRKARTVLQWRSVSCPSCGAQPEGICLSFRGKNPFEGVNYIHTSRIRKLEAIMSAINASFPTIEKILAGFQPIEEDAQLCVEETRIHPDDVEEFKISVNGFPSERSCFEAEDRSDRIDRGVLGYFCGTTVYADTSIPRGKVRLSTNPKNLFSDSPNSLSEPVVVWV